MLHRELLRDNIVRDVWAVRACRASHGGAQWIDTFRKLPESKIRGIGMCSSRNGPQALVCTHPLELVGASVCYVPLSTVDKEQIAPVSWSEVADAWLRLLHTTETWCLMLSRWTWLCCSSSTSCDPRRNKAHGQRMLQRSPEILERKLKDGIRRTQLFMFGIERMGGLQGPFCSVFAYNCKLPAYS